MEKRVIVGHRNKDRKTPPNPESVGSSKMGIVDMPNRKRSQKIKLKDCVPLPEWLVHQQFT